MHRRREIDTPDRFSLGDSRNGVKFMQKTLVFLATFCHNGPKGTVRGLVNLKRAVLQARYGGDR